MDNNNQPASGYRKLEWWQWVLIYAVIAAVAYGALYYFYLRPRGIAPYSAPFTAPVTQTQTQSSGAPNAISGTAAVAINNFAFAPTPLTVKKGAVVTWTNYDKVPHTVTGSLAGFASPDLRSGATYSYTFTDVGTFTYNCSFHPSMTGVVRVVE